MRATGMPRLDRHDRGVAGIRHGCERTDAAGNRLGDSLQFQGEFRDHAERAFRADHQPGEVVARRRFLGAARRGHQFAVRQHDLEREHDVLHRAVAHRVGAGAARRCHSPKRGVGAGIERKEQALIAQILVELLARHARFDHAVEVLGVHFDHPVHVAEIDRYAPIGRVDVAFKRGSGAEGNDRHPMRRANPDDVLHVLGGLRKHHRVRRLVRDPGRGVGVLFAHRLRGDEPVAEFLRQRAYHGLDSLGIAAARGGLCV